MKAMLGEEGTEQFEITTRLNGCEVGRKMIHDPFVHNTLIIGWMDILKCLLRFKASLVEVNVSGTQPVQRRVMTIEPEECIQEAREQLLSRHCPENSFLSMESTSNGLHDYRS